METVPDNRLIYRLKITLSGSKPAIWRRFHVPADTNLIDLHEVVQRVMGWEAQHSHEFRQGDLRYGIPDDERDRGDVYDELGYQLYELLESSGDTLHYLYDFGDGWEHEIALEAILPDSTAETFPHCTDGAGACPPEDIGGIPGYEQFRRVMGNPDDPEYGEMLEWYGEPFDSTAFDKGSVNEMLTDYFASDVDLDTPPIDDALMQELRAYSERLFPVHGKVNDGYITGPGLGGYLIAILCAPVLIVSEEWLVNMHRVFNNKRLDQRGDQDAYATLMHAHFSRAMEAGEFMLPNLSLEGYDTGTSQVELWSDGFLRGLHVARDYWLATRDRRVREQVDFFMDLIAGIASRDCSEFNDAESGGSLDLAKAIDMIPEIVDTLNELGCSEAYAHLDVSRHQPVVVGEKIGRNHPCPCGSGKKYKKCCMNKGGTIH